MTDEIKDLFKEFKARAYSPLFGSFVIAWLCINWYIPVALFFYKQSDLCLDGYSSYREMIWANTTTWFNILPAFIAIIYTFGYPYIKAKIIEHQTKVNTDSDNKIVLITAKLHSHEKIIQEKEEKYNLLDEIKKKEEEGNKKLRGELVVVEAKLKDANKSLKEAQLELNRVLSLKKELGEANSESFLNGEWELTVNGTILDKKTVQWNISMGTIYLIKPDDSGTEQIGSIQSHVYFDKTLTLTYKVINTNIFRTLNLVTIDDKRFVGNDDQGRQVIFNRIKS